VIDSGRIAVAFLADAAALFERWEGWPQPELVIPLGSCDLESTLRSGFTAYFSEIRSFGCRAWEHLAVRREPKNKISSLGRVLSLTDILE